MKSIIKQCPILYAAGLIAVCGQMAFAQDATADEAADDSSQAAALIAAELAPLPPSATGVTLSQSSGSYTAGTGTTVFTVAKVLTVDESESVINNASIVVDDGDIAWVGKTRDLTINDGATHIEMPNAWLTPGFVELHNHTAGALSDLNDGVYLTNPGLRTLETVVANTFEVEQAQAGGVTSALLIPGSGNNMAGFGTAVKFSGDTVEEIAMKTTPGSLKIAQAGNPEGYWLGVGRTFMNWNTRGTLKRAKAYHELWASWENGDLAEQPRFDPNFDEMRGLFTKDFPASVHTQGYQLVMSTVSMLANELDIMTVLDHSTFDGYGIAPYVLETGEDKVMTMVGPRGLNFDFRERKIHGNVWRWYEGGVRRLGINTDAPVIPQEELVFQGSMACWLGLDPYVALQGLTRYPAQALMIEDQTGTIEVEKDADFVLWSGHPIDPRSYVLQTIVDGDIVYDAERDGRRF